MFHLLVGGKPAVVVELDWKQRVESLAKDIMMLVEAAVIKDDFGKKKTEKMKSCGETKRDARECKVSCWGLEIRLVSDPPIN